MSTFYAAFPDGIQAEQMARQLLEDGVEIDDISVVTRGSDNIEASGGPAMGDASYFVGRDDDPPTRRTNGSRGALYEAAEESEIGGGIATDTMDRSADSVDQMEDSQEVAEREFLEPREDASHASHEMDDLNRAVRTGFPTPVTPLDKDRAKLPSDADAALQSILVNGLGLVIGGGDLATAAFDWNGKSGNPDSTAFLTYLQDEGVTPAAANEMLDIFGNGGSILAVALTPKLDEAALEEAANTYGAVTSGWFGAPRY